jgi:hypothetical protein
VVAFGVVFFVVLFIAALAGPKSALGALLATAFIALAICGAAAYYIFLQRRAVHAVLLARKEAEFKDGILLLPSGDIVVNFEGLLPGSSVSFEVAAERFIAAEVSAGFSAWTCNAREQALVIYFHDDFGRTVTVRVPQHELATPVQDIADSITATLTTARARA